MKDRIVLVTGATAGIGEIAATEIAKKGATVVLVSRDPKRCEEAAQRMREASGNPKVDFLVGDLAVMKSVREVAHAFLAKYKKLHVLLNNAGATFMKRYETSEGNEQTFALNHLNYFLLTHLLLPVMKETQKADGDVRIVNVSSGAHMGSRGIHFEDFQAKKKYSGWFRYCDSKLANLLFTYELAERLGDTGITVNALHPGFVRTRFGHDNPGLWGKLIKWSQIFAISPEKGAETSIYLATSPDVQGVSGKYFYKKKARKTNKASYNKEAQRRLWELSAQITGAET